MAVERNIALNKAMNRILAEVNGQKVVISSIKLASEAFPDSRCNWHGRNHPQPEEVHEAAAYLRSWTSLDQGFKAKVLSHFGPNLRLEVERK